MVDRAFGTHDRWHLFIDDEVFFDLSNASWNQNRLRAGGGARLNRRFFLDGYYLQRNPSGGVPSTLPRNYLECVAYGIISSFR